MSEENKKKLREGWYWGIDGEIIEINGAPFKTVEEALDCLKSQYFTEFTDIDKQQSYLIFGEEYALRIADYLDDNVERLNDDLYEFHDNGGEGPFYCSEGEAQSLDAALKAAADKWQREHNIKASYVNFREESKQMIEMADLSVAIDDTSVDKMLQSFIMAVIDNPKDVELSRYFTDYEKHDLVKKLKATVKTWQSENVIAIPTGKILDTKNTDKVEEAAGRRTRGNPKTAFSRNEG